MKAPLLAMMALAGTALTPLNAGAEPLTLVLDWFVNPDHGPIFVAQDQGYFEDEGLEVRIEAPADPNDPPKLVAAGKYDLAVSYQPQLHIQVDAGLPLVRIGTLVATPLNTVIVLEDSEIRSISDLKGKRIGYSVGGLEEAMLGGVLENSGLSLKDVELINVNWSLSPALIAGQVDATIGGYRNFELNQMEIEGYPGRGFFVEEEGVPPYDELIFVASRDNADAPEMAAFMRAIERGVQYLVNHPEEAWDSFVAEQPDLDDELNRRAWTDTMRHFALRPAALDRGRYERFAAFLQERGLIGEPPAVDSYAIEPR